MHAFILTIMFMLEPVLSMGIFLILEDWLFNRSSHSVCLKEKYQNQALLGLLLLIGIVSALVPVLGFASVSDLPMLYTIGSSVFNAIALFFFVIINYSQSGSLILSQWLKDWKNRHYRIKDLENASELDILEWIKSLNSPQKALKWLNTFNVSIRIEDRNAQTCIVPENKQITRALLLKITELMDKGLLNKELQTLPVKSAPIKRVKI